MPTTRLRDAVARLTARATLDLDALWRQVNDAVQAREALRDVLPAIVDNYGAAAGTLAAEWYDQQRLKAGVAGRFTADPVDPRDAGTDALAGYGVGPLFAKEPDWAAARTLVSGGLQRRIANVSRQTVMQSSIADPQARGWVRVGTGACKSGWCDQFLDGEIHYVEGYDFPAHDHCTCSTVPAF